MAESAALLIDEVFPKEPIRQWVLSFPFQLRFLLARHPQLMGQVLSIVYRTLSTHLIKKAASFTAEGDQTLVMTILAANPHETILQTATLEEVVEFLLDVARQVLTLGFE